MGMETADCFICRKHRGEIHVAGGCIYEDDYVYVGHIGSSGSAVYMGYVMVDLKRHVAGYGDMTEDEASAVGSVLNRIGKALKETEGAEHVYSFVQGDAFPHFHVHLIPRYPGTPEEYWHPTSIRGYEAAYGTANEVEALCVRLKEVLYHEAG